MPRLPSTIHTWWSHHGSHILLDDWLEQHVATSSKKCPDFSSSRTIRHVMWPLPSVSFWDNLSRHRLCSSSIWLVRLIEWIIWKHQQRSSLHSMDAMGQFVQVDKHTDRLLEITFRYGFEGLVVNQWSRVDNSSYTNFYRDVILDQFSFKHDNYQLDVIGLSSIVVFFYLAGFIALLVRIRLSRWSLSISKNV